MKNCQDGRNTGVSPDETSPDKWRDGHDDHERAIVKHTPKPGTALRSLDYRKRTGGRWQRCSRCHREHELTAPVLYNVGGQQLSGLQLAGLIPIVVGQDLMGFVCGDCFHATLQHVASLFPDAMGFPHIDNDGMIVPTPRCECGAPLHYAPDGRTLLCSQPQPCEVSGG